MKADLSNLLRKKTRFGALVIDPPWSFNDKGSRVAPDVMYGKETDKKKYPTMTLGEIVEMGGAVQRLAADVAHLYLWVPSAMMKTHPWPVIEAFGFDYKTMGIWLKETVNGKRAFGAGHYFRGAHEVCLFATRGRAPALSRSVRSVWGDLLSGGGIAFSAPVGEHSSKPKTVHEVAEAISRGPFLELFARQKRKGWTTWGNQV